MNILHINMSDISGGAAIAGYRLHQGLLQEKVESYLLAGSLALPDSHSATLPRRRRLENELYRFTSRLGLNFINLVGSFDIPKHAFFKSADIINTHNLCTNHFSYLAIPKLNQTKPIVITLHEMYNFTGHCGFSFDCDRWQSGCGSCPYPQTYPPITRDNTNLEWRLKKWSYDRATNITVVAPSKWLAEQAQKSMIGRFPVHHIPYGIDTDRYLPIDRQSCRQVLGIPTNKQVLLFGAQSLNQPRKGGDLLIEALEAIPASLKPELFLLTLGDGGQAIAKTVGIETLSLGYVSNDRLKAMVYSAADLFVFPTRADNLPLVLQESMACGTPMASFRVGGVPELVRPGITGALAEPENALELRDRIVELLGNPEQLQMMAHNCREIAIAEYALNLQATRYMELYQQILA